MFGCKKEAIRRYTKSPQVTAVNEILVYNTRLASKKSYSLPKTRTNFIIFNIRYQGPKIWNSLDESDKKLLKSHELPERPWQTIAADLFELDKQEYVVMVDYQSMFFAVSHLPNSKSKTVINHIKPQFARYGIPEVIVSDNGLQNLLRNTASSIYFITQIATE